MSPVGIDRPAHDMKSRTSCRPALMAENGVWGHETANRPLVHFRGVQAGQVEPGGALARPGSAGGGASAPAGRSRSGQDEPEDHGWRHHAEQRPDQAFFLPRSPRFVAGGHDVPVTKVEICLKNFANFSPYWAWPWFTGTQRTRKAQHNYTKHLEVIANKDESSSNHADPWKTADWRH